MIIDPSLEQCTRPVLAPFKEQHMLFRSSWKT